MTAGYAALARRVEAALDRLAGRRRVHLLHLGKTGGTALEQALRPHTRGRALRIVLHPHTATLRDVPPGEKFVFSVRDPVARFVSAFNGRKRQGRPRYLNPWNPHEQVAFERFASADALALSLSSSLPDERRAATDAMRGIYHVNSHYWDWFEDEAYFVARTSDLLAILFQESLSADFDLLVRLLGLPASLRLPADDELAHRAPREIEAPLDAESQRNLRAWYQGDYEFVKLCARWREQSGLFAPAGASAVPRCV